MANDKREFLVPEYAKRPSDLEIQESEGKEPVGEGGKLDQETKLSVSETEHGTHVSELDPQSGKEILTKLIRISTAAGAAEEKGQILEMSGVTETRKKLNELGMDKNKLNPEDIVPLLKKGSDAAVLQEILNERPEDKKAA